MRVLHVADLHLEHAWFEWLASDAPAHDVLVIAGDLQNAFSNVPMHSQAREISRWLLARTTPTVVCSGNHDYWTKSRNVSVDPDANAAWLTRLHGQGQIIATDGDIVDHCGLRIAVNGWTQTPELQQRVDLLVTHAPPSGSRCATGVHSGDCGDPGLWSTIEACTPGIILSGHIHEPYNRWERLPGANGEVLVLVPGLDEGSDTPAHWLLNFDRQKATHSSGETADLPAIAG